MRPFNKRLKKGDSTAFVEIYDQIGDKLFRYVFARVGCSQDASDIVQEVFVRLVKSHRSFARAECLTSYVFTVARNETIRWFDKSQRHKTQSLSAIEQQAEQKVTPDFERHIEGSDWIENVLILLDSVEKEIVQLKVFSQLTFNEIATVLQMQQSNVATRYRRAISKLESRLSAVQPKHERKQ